MSTSRPRYCVCSGDKADLDPRVGFLHDVHPERSSLACDLVEPLRVPLVDRLVVGSLNRKVFQADSFRQRDHEWRLKQDAFRRFLANFEQTFDNANQSPTYKQQTEDVIARWSDRIRSFSSSRHNME